MTRKIKEIPPEEIHDAELISKSIITQHENMQLSTSGKTIIANTSNALQVLQHNENFNGNIWFDEFHQKIFTTYNPEQDDFGKMTREWDEEDNIRLSVFMQRELQMSNMSDETVGKAIRVYSRKNIKNEPKDWMSKLIWDHVPRVETFLIDCAGTVDDEYIRAVSKNFWISLIARVFSPGCKVDTMPILEGGQGEFKSTLFNIIGGKWHCEASHDLYNKDFFQGLHGKLIIEFADLAGFTKSEVNIIKDILTRKVDYLRVPYAKIFKNFPRQSVFVGTTNKTTYLKDETGARRFWPVKIGKINIQRAKDERDQLFAEAVFLFKNNIEWWHMPGQTQEEQEERREIDPWESIIANFIINKEEVTIQEIMIQGLQIQPNKQDKYAEMRIGGILRLFGWDRRQKRIGNLRPYVYFPKDSLPSLVENLPDQHHINWED